MSKIFISYRSLDSAKVDVLVSRLRGLNYEVWQDKDSIPVGHDWWESITDAILACDIFLFMVSRESVKSTPCLAELSFADKLNRAIIPIVLEGEFAYNSKTGKHDIDFWAAIPQALDDRRAQFLFYEGTASFQKLNVAIEQLLKKLPRPTPANRPLDPRHSADTANNPAFIYDAACDYALRAEFATADKLFRRLLRSNFADEAAHWIDVLHAYQEIVTYASMNHTRFRVKKAWQSYQAYFPRDFLETFDPKDMTSIAHAKPKTDKAKELLPAPFDWCPIPAGKVTLMPDETDKKNNYLKADTTFDVPAFDMAKYPVTNAQYEKFINAKGYHDKQWWTADGWQVCQEGWAWDDNYEWKPSSKAWTEPRYWQDTRFNGRNQPVVGVSWYESLAFCTWLSTVTGDNIMLPSEQQWQRAAQAKADGGDTGWVYVWGNEWDGKKCNTSEGENNSLQTTVVTHYEKLGNVSPCGVVDLIGNVWEWCLTEYETGKTDVNGTNVRVLRGGSWVNINTGYFRVVSRYWFFPHHWDAYSGFRVSRFN